jgi:hypothetical protein
VLTALAADRKELALHRERHQRLRRQLHCQLRHLEQR